MANKISILITGGGAPGIAGTIYALRNNPDGQEFNIVTCDANDNVVGKYLADDFVQIPLARDHDFITVIKEVVADFKIDVVLPLVEGELIPLASEEIGAKKCLSSYESLNLATNKEALLYKASALGIPTPNYSSFGPGKLVLKSPYGSGGDGIAFVEREGETLICEYLPGLEYTVDCFRGSEGFIAIPRVREKVRDGITFDARVDLREDLIDYSRELADSIDLKYCFGFQFKEDKDGNPRLLECNPRVQGTMVTSIFAGFNVIYAGVMEALGHPVDLSEVKLKDGVKFKRYWGGLGIDGDDVKLINL